MSTKFNKSKVLDTAQEYIYDVLYHSGFDTDNYCKQATELLQSIIKTEQILLTHSCTAALEMAAILINIEPGDEVIMPSYTFVSTANAFVLRGAVPVFVDIREDTLNIDEKLIEAAITPKTKAIVPVHYAGVGCDMDAIMAIAQRHNLYVIEDAAQCIGAKYKGKHLGTIGHFGTLSFHHTKNIISGHGGALIINDDKFIDRAKIIWQKGTNREAFLDGQVDKYTWCDIGSSFMMSELSAALLFSQLEDFEIITNKRLDIWNKYHDAFKELENKGCLSRPNVPDPCEHNGHIYYLIMPSHEIRDSLLHELRASGIGATFHYIPLHTSRGAVKFPSYSDQLESSIHMAQTVLRLPLHTEISEQAIIIIRDKISVKCDEFLKQEEACRA